MRRRSLLSAAGTLGAALLAGCTGAGPGGPGGERTTTETTTETTTTATSTTTTTDPATGTTGPSDGGEAFEFDPASDEPFEEVAVGSRENVLMPEDNSPHAVSVWNAADTEREIRILVAEEGEAVLDRTVAFPADQYLTVTLQEPGSYEVALFLDGAEVWQFSVGTGWFDCNDSATNVGVFEDRVEHVSISTTMACGSPQIADHAFEVTGTRCGERNDGSLAAEERTVTLSGHLRTPDPCHGAALSVAGVERGEAFGDPAKSITLLVTPTDPGEGMCQQCVGEVAYKGAVTFEEAVPEAVVLVHESGGERTEVART